MKNLISPCTARLGTYRKKSPDNLNQVTPGFYIYGIKLVMLYRRTLF